MHDFALFRKTNFSIAENICLLADSGYQGLGKEHENSQTPTKKPRGGKLSAAERSANRELSRQRIMVENVIRHLKIFRIIAERYRNRRRRFGLRFNLIAGLYNYEIGH
jgi:DDE superfamily endonuclease